MTSIGSRECDESLDLARGPNFEFHARSIGPYLRDGRSRSGDIREHSPRRIKLSLELGTPVQLKCRSERQPNLLEVVLRAEDGEQGLHFMEPLDLDAP